MTKPLVPQSFRMGGHGAKKGAPSTVAKLSPKMARMAKRALTARPEDVAAYHPREADVRIVESIIMNGSCTAPQIAKDLDVHTNTIQRILTEATRMAWICEQVDAGIEFRMPLIRAGMYMKARNGDVRAAEILIKHFEKPTGPDQHVHLHAGLGFDPQKMSDKDLDAVLKSKGVSMPGKEIDEVNKD